MADDNDVSIRFGADLEGVEEGSNEAKEKIAELVEHIKEFGEQAKEANEKAGEHFKELGEGVGEIKEHLLELAEVFGVAFSLDALKEFIEQNAELGEQLERTAAKLGITGEEASGLMGVAKLTGTSFDGLQTAMERLQVGLATVDAKSSRTAEALRVLGVSAKEMASSSISQQINILSEAISKFQDGATKTAAVQALGRSSVELLPLLDKGKEGLDELNETLDATGAKLSTQMVAALAHTNEDLKTMKEAWEAVGEKIFSAFNPSIDAAAVKMTKFLEKFKDSDIKTWVNAVVEDFQEFEIKTTALIQDVIDTVNALKAALQSMYNFLPTNKELLDKIGIHPWGAVPGSPGGGGVPPSAGAFGAIEGVGDTSLSQKIKDNAFSAAVALDQLRKSAAIAAEGLHDRGPVGGGESGKAKVPQMQLGGGADKDTAAKDAEQQFSADVQASKAAEASIAEDLENRLKLHQITMKEWLQQSNVALDAEALAVINAADKATANAALNSQQRKAIWDKEERDLAEIALKEQKDFDKAAQETTKSWTTAGDAIAGILNSQVNSLLKGTETIAQAFRNMAASIIEDLIKVAIKIAAEAAALEALSLATGGALGGFGAGGFGGFLSGALHFAEGTNYVPTTGFHHLDQGEAVIPAHLNPSNPANSLSFGGGQRGGNNSGGGNTIHNHNWGGVHVNNTGGELDPANVAKAMDKAVRSGAHTGLKAFAR